MKNRDLYLNQLIEFKDKPLIKVITGIRRCGKSTLLLLFEKYLLDSGVSPNNIIKINFESMKYDHLKDYKDLYEYIMNKITNKNNKTYILLDEVQQITSWEKTVNSLLLDINADLYITGSNAYLLSSELSTLLTGRYVEIKMQTLSFKEFMNFTNSSNKDLEASFNTYLTYGGLPAIAELIDNPNTIGPFLEGIYNTVLMKDVISRNNVRDAALLESILKYIAANIGSNLSTRKISNYLTSNGRKTASETIDNYLKMLEDAFIIYKANRYDLKGKLFLKTLEKYYMSDIGIRNQLTGLRNTDYGHILENIIYLELIRRGYQVKIGKIGTVEIDFIAENQDEKIYYQVSATIMEENTKTRELRPLLAVVDNYPKYILTMDNTPFTDHQGIKIVNIIDFLLE